jgi:SSS family solute:Na+ symporter
LSLPAGADPGVKGGWLAVMHVYPSEMAQNFWTAIWAFGASFGVIVAVSLITTPRPAPTLQGLVYAVSPLPAEPDAPWYLRTSVWAGLVLCAAFALNLLFW